MLTFVCLLFDLKIPNKRVRAMLKLCFTALCLIIIFVEVEFLSGTDFVSLLQNNVLASIIGLGFVAATFGIFFAFFGKSATALRTTLLLFALLSYVSYFVLAFRGTPFVPLDILSVETAAMVVGGYTFAITPALVRATLIYLCIFLVAPRLNFEKKRTDFYRNLRTGSFVVSIIFLVGFSSQWLGSLSLYPNAFNQVASMQANGAILNFVGNISASSISRPFDYSAEGAQKIADDYPSDSVSDATVKPDVILILGESWANFTAAGSVTTNKPVLPFIESLSDAENGLYSKLLVSTIGGGTSSSEFQLLAGVNLEFGLYNAPFQHHVKSSVPTIVSQFKQLGYGTTALHTGYASAWSRDTAFPILGFDQYLTQDHLTTENNRFVRNYLADEVLYDKMLALLDEADEPQFLYGITIQTHGGYTDEAYLSEFAITSPTGDYPQAEQYLSLMHESDKDLEAFISALEKRERPTLVLIFGDHRPAIESDILKASSASQFRDYETFFAVWANYPLPDAVLSPSENLGINYLGAYLMQAAGLPLTGYEKFLLETKETYPALVSEGILDNNGTLFTEPYDKNAIKEYTSMSLLQYNLLMDRDNYPQDFYSLRED